MPTAIGGYAYMAKYTDHHSRLKAVYFIEKKSNTLHTLGRFIQDLAIPPGLRVQHLRSDNRDEYTSGSFKEYYKSTGIRQQFSAPYTPQQNGVSERDGRTIMDMTRCSLNEAHLPKTLWGEIASTAVFLINRLPHPAIGGDTPYHRMFGKHADLSFLRIIGTRAFVHVEGYTTKLQPNAWEGVLVGYDSDKPTFRVYDRYNTGRISSSRNIYFIEEPPTVLPTADSGGQEPEVPDFDLEPGSDFMDDYQSIKHGISSLETSDTDATGNEPFHMRLRSSTSQAKARQQALQCQDSPKQQFEAVSQYIGAVGMDKINPPASILVPNTYAQAMASPQAEKWEATMHKELKGVDEHEVADLIPFTKVPPGCSIIGTRWVFRVKTDGRFKATLVVQGWAQQHGLDCFTTFAPV